MPVQEEQILFTKPSSAVCGPNDPILLPPGSQNLDWEVGLGVVISKPTLGIDKASAMDHVFGFTIVNDVSEREWQLERGGKWSKGKGYPNFCPAGPWPVTTDAVEVLIYYSLNQQKRWLRGLSCDATETGRLGGADQVLTNCMTDGLSAPSSRRKA